MAAIFIAYAEVVASLRDAIHQPQPVTVLRDAAASLVRCYGNPTPFGVAI